MSPTAAIVITGVVLVALAAIIIVVFLMEDPSE